MASLAEFPVHPVLLLALLPLILLLVWPIAKRSGKFEADLTHGLVDDLKQGRSRGYAILAVVVAIIVLAPLLS